MLSKPSGHPALRIGGRLRFGHIEVDLDAEEFRVAGRPLEIEPLPARLLLYLIRHRQRVVPRAELVRAVWGSGTEVREATLSRALLKARRAIGDDARNPLVRTVARVGYRFVAATDADGAGRADRGPLISMALLPFENITGDAGLGWVQLALPGLLGQILARHARVAPVPLSSVRSALERVRAAPAAEQVAAVQRATGAAAVVQGILRRTAGGLHLAFRLWDGRGKHAGSVFETDAARLAGKLAMQIAQRLGVHADGIDVALDLPRDPLAAEAYVRGIQAVLEQRLAHAIDLFRLSLELEPGHIIVGASLLEQLARSQGVSTDELPTMASDLLERARAAGDRRTMVDVHLALAASYASLHQPARSEQEVLSAIAMSDGSEGPMYWADKHARLAVAAFGLGEQDVAREHAARARQLFELGGNRVLLMHVMLTESGIRIAEGDYAQATALCLEVAAEARQLGLLNTLGMACNNGSMGLVGLGRVDEAIALGAEGIACSVSVANRALIDQLAETVAFASRLAGRRAIAGRVLAELDALPGPPHSAGVVAVGRGFHHGCQGDWGRAARDIGLGFEAARSIGNLRFAAYVFPWWIEALLLAGELDAAGSALAATDAALLDSYERGVGVMLVRAALAHRRGDCTGALDWLRRALDCEPAPIWRAWACADAAWLHAEAGESQAAARLLEGLDGPAAGLPIVEAARARVRHAAGDLAGAAALHREYLAARQEPGWHTYHDELGAAYERQLDGTAVPLPLIPFLPSRVW
jgi:DNA-binding winged helix-turn-helix (wHTH) protein/tetratricopeptide (TPR) repeat protein